MSSMNIRCYGILYQEEKGILVSDEFIRGMYITKFPGGGLEFGEGSRDCIKREFMEEMLMDVEVKEHIYTTDFFQISAFNPAHQIISIYYWVKAVSEPGVPVHTDAFQFTEAQMQVYREKREIESARYIPWDSFTAKQVTLPIDKLVCRIIKENGKPS